MITAACLGAARFCGLGRELLVAARSGPSSATDAVYVALTFVTTATTVLVMTLPNTVSRVFYARDSDPAERHRRVSGCLTLWTGLLVVAAVAIAAFPEALLSVLAHPGSSGFRSEGVLALRLAALILILQGVFLPLAAVGNAEGWHTPVALLSTGFPLGGLLGALAFHPWLGPASVLMGIVVASTAQVGLLAWYLRSRGVSFGGGPMSELGPALRALWRVGAPVALGTALLKLDSLLMVRLASDLRSGDVFLFSVAGMLVNVPMSVANQAVAQTTVPDLVRSSAAGEGGRLDRVFRWASELTVFFIAPCAALMVVDAEGVVGLLFRRGRFTAESVERTAAVLRVWAAASPLLSLNLYMEEALMACGARGRVAVGRGVSVALMGAACWLGAHRGGLAGMVLGFVLVNVARYLVAAEAVVRLAGVRRSAFWASQGKVLTAGLLAAAAAAGMGAACRAVALRPLPRLTLEGLAVAAVMLAACAAWKVESVRRGLAAARAALTSAGRLRSTEAPTW